MIELLEEFVDGERAKAFLSMLAKNAGVRTDKKLFNKLEDNKGYLAPDLHKDTAVISFYDPKDGRGLARLKEYKPINYNGICDCVFMVGVHDIDIEILGDYGLTYETYFPEVEELADFIYMAVECGMDIICQCEHGQSRSAACAAAIKEHFDKSGIEVFADYRYYPNQLIFNKIHTALKAQNIPK